MAMPRVLDTGNSASAAAQIMDMDGFPFEDCSAWNRAAIDVPPLYLSVRYWDCSQSEMLFAGHSPSTRRTRTSSASQSSRRTLGNGIQY